MALPEVPGWLTSRSGSLQSGIRDSIVMVYFDGRPNYRLESRPMGGGHTCNVTQTVNGKRVDAGKQYQSQDAALMAGLRNCVNDWDGKFRVKSSPREPADGHISHYSGRLRVPTKHLRLISELILT